MTYRQAIEEYHALVSLDGIRNDKGQVVKPFKFKAFERLQFARRLKNLTEILQEHDQARLAKVKELDILGKNENECDPEVWREFQKFIEEINSQDCGLHPMKWKPAQMNLEENDIPITALTILLDMDGEGARA